MNRNNRGYELPDLNLPANEIAPVGDFVPPGMGEAANASARTLAGLAEQQGRQADKIAVRQATIAGLKAGQADQVQPVDTTTLSGEAYVKGAAEAVNARYEVTLRDRLSKVATDFPDDPDGFEKAAQSAVGEVLGPLTSQMRKDPENPQWALMGQQFSGLAAQIISGEAAQRRALQARKTVESQRDDLAARADQRMVSFERATRDAAKGTPEAIAAQGQSWASWRDSLAALGPKEGFVLDGVEYGPDQSRAGAYNVAGLEGRVKAGRLNGLAIQEVAKQELAGNGEAQKVYAEAFAKKWRERPAELAWLDDDDAEKIEITLKQQAAQTLGEERQIEADKREQVGDLMIKVQAGGRLSKEEREQGDLLVGSIGDVGLQEQWGNAKTLSQTGARMIADAGLRSVYGGAAPRQRLGRVYAAEPRVRYARLPQGAYGGGRRSRRGDDDGDDAPLMLAPPKGAAPGTPGFAAWANLSSNATADPIKFAHRQNMNPPALNAMGLVTGNSALGRQAEGVLRGRFNFGNQLSQQMGVPARVFTNAEVAFYKDRFANNPRDALVFATRARQALGNQAASVLAEVGLTGNAGVAARLVANGQNPAYANRVLNGAQGREASLPDALKKDLDRSYGEFRKIAARNPALAQQMPAMRAAVENVMRSNIADGLPPGSPASHFQAMFGGTERGGVQYGGATNVNGAFVVVPSWLRRDAMDDFMKYSAQGIATHATFANGRALTPREASRMQLIPLGGDRYMVATGRVNAQGQMMVLRDKRDPNLAYEIDLNKFRRVLARERPNWVAR